MDLNLKALNQLFNAKREFWITNVIGWLVLYVINVILQTKYFKGNFEAIYYTIIIVGTGFLLSLFLRVIYAKIILQNGPILWTILKGVLGLVTICFVKTLIDPFLFFVFGLDDFDETFDFVPYMVSMMLFLSIWSLIYFNYKYFENQKKIETDKLKLSLELKQLELSNLKDQLSPHFLFNAINNIRSLILLDPEGARDSLVNVSELLRYILNYQNKTMVSIGEELEVVKSYIQLNQLHFGNKVDFLLNVDESLENVDIPPLSIQLLLENAIKHGEIKKGNKIEVHVFEEDGKAVIKVKNVGELMGDLNNGIGLKNLVQRLKVELYENANFSIFQTQNIVTSQITINTN
ncbi:sensor histidine kinase [Flammeovirga sp. EKP202]|uniref:sensor histidine kinase n=1 Tax=Flammeovirga sp. EKP202 TaxID=2770592 RepID=UPI00165F6D90|nr:histidine kinase [Flammeovirga sp. EKP202]MBD0405443.1 histidine kinase [Flammeovirga sp. EKP202]